VSRLAGRLARLEQRLGGCPGCAHRRPLVELATPHGRRIPGGDHDTGPCPDCGQPRGGRGFAWAALGAHAGWLAGRGSKPKTSVSSWGQPNGRPAAGGTRAPAELRPHPQAALVPPMTAEHYQAFRADIARRGVLCPLEITTTRVVLDGHARLRAARELGLSQLPVRVVAPPDEPEYMILAALQRRQLTASQRAALALELDSHPELKANANARRLANLRQTEATEVAALPPRGKTRELVAGWAGVSARTVQDAATVHAHDPQLFARIKAGTLAADVAARQVRRALRDAQLPQPPPLPTEPFELLYADPPWQLGNPDGPNAPENHYPTLPLSEIKQLTAPATDNACLFLWAVNCLLPQALELIDAWGFSYKTNLVWVKPSIGLGVWTRNRHELLLFATRGRIDVPDPERRPDSVLEAARGAHSQKPQAVYQLIERAYPQLSKLELFARGTARPGWTAWGNETTPT
jgi:N6-adenosine-specific RNA methylase IME4/ParB-like chromosome segregation protein Spo0J